MSKLVDKERLARLAAALDSRAKAAVAAEESRARAKEQELENAISTINGENGILANAKAYADEKDAEMKKVLDEEDLRIAGLVAAEENRAVGVETDHETRIAKNEAFVAAQPAIDEAQNDKLDALETKDGELDQAIKDEAAAARAAEEALDGRVDNLEAFKGEAETKHTEMQNAINALNAKFDGEDSVDNKINGVDDKVDALEVRVKSNEDDLAVVQGADTVEGSIAKAEKDAKAYADQQIAALVDSAPDAMNTLNELAQAISNNKGVYDAYVEQHAQSMANLKKDLQAEIDADVKVVADELDKQKDAAQEGTLAKQIADEKAAREAKDTNLEGRVSANEAFVTAQPGIDNAQNNRIAALEGYFEGEDSVDAKIQAVQNNLDAHEEAAETKNSQQDLAITNAQKAADDAQAAADKAQEEVDAVEGRMGTAESEIDALQAFMNAHSHTTMEQNISANATAIENEVKKDGNRDQAIKAALTPYETKANMMTILGNVVNSLALTMDENKLMLKLGGVEGIIIHETSLDMATDDDIDAIINGLDAE